jgi:hypothetical protein
MTNGLRAQPSLTPMHRGRLQACSRRHAHVDGHQRQSGRTSSRNTPSTITSPIRRHPGSRTEIRLGVRAHHHPTDHLRGPPQHPAAPPTLGPGLIATLHTDKEKPVRDQSSPTARHRRATIAAGGPATGPVGHQCLPIQTWSSSTEPTGFATSRHSRSVAQSRTDEPRRPTTAGRRLQHGPDAHEATRLRPGCFRFSPAARAAQPPPIGIVMTTRSASTGRLRTGSLECTPSSSTTAT